MSEEEIQAPKRKSISNQLPPILIITMLTILIGTILGILVSITGVTAGGQYLYNPGKDDKETLADVFPVVEYVSPSKLPSETKEDYEERVANPTFLTKDDNTDRVVLLYAPWCGHCIHFKPKYIELARQVNKEHPLTFHAISCVAHKKICNDQDIRGYPAIKWFSAGQGTGELMDRFHLNKKYIFQQYLHLDGKDINDDGGSRVRIGGGQISKSKSKAQGGSMLAMFRQNNVFTDASLSWEFAMRTSIFMTNNALNQKQKTTLKSWLELLEKTLPHAEQMKRIVASNMQLLHSFNEIVQSEEKLLAHMGPDRKQEWSRGCSKGKDGAGYTCGLWSIFHIMTIGLVQWNAQEAHTKDKVSTEDAGRILRDYIEEFFGCNACRENFIRMYDDGQFDRLSRLSMDVSTESDTEWKQLSLWLWEVHNDVNVRLLKEDNLDKGVKAPTEAEEQNVRWPSKQDCPSCWQDGGGWDEDEVYFYLESYYWPQKKSVNTDFKRHTGEIPHIESFGEPMKVVKHAMEEIKKNESRDVRISAVFLFLLVIVTIFICRTRKRRLMIRRQKSV